MIFGEKDKRLSYPRITDVKVSISEFLAFKGIIPYELKNRIVSSTEPKKSVTHRWSFLNNISTDFLSVNCIKSVYVFKLLSGYLLTIWTNIYWAPLMCYVLFQALNSIGTWGNKCTCVHRACIIMSEINNEQVNWFKSIAYFKIVIWIMKN